MKLPAALQRLYPRALPALLARHPRLRRGAWIAAGVVLAVGIYGAGGHWLLPWAARAPLERALAKATGGSAQIESLHLQPFSLVASVRGVTLRDAGQKAWAGVGEITANLTVASLWRRRIELQRLSIRGPWLSGRVAPDGRFVLPLPARPDDGAPDAAPPPVQINTLELGDGRLTVTDESRAAPLELGVEALTAQGVALGTRGSGKLNLSGTLTGGGSFTVQGDLGLTPPQAALTFALQDFPLTRAQPYLPPAMSSALSAGVLGLAGALRYDDGALRITGGRAELTALALSDAAGAPLLRVPALTVADVALDLPARRVQVGAIKAQDLEANLSRSATGELNFAALMASPAPGEAPASVSQEPAVTAAQREALATSTAGTPPSSAPGAASAPAPWSVDVARVELGARQIRVRDAAVNPALDATLAPISLTLTNLRPGTADPAGLKLAASLAGGSLEATGELVLAPLGATLDITARGLPLPLAQPYLAGLAKLELRSGALDAQGRVAYGAPDADLYSGQLAVRDLELWNTARDESLARFKQLALESVRVSPQRAELGTVILEEPYARMEIGADGNTNLSGLLVTAPATDTSAPSRAAPRAEPAGAPAGKGNAADPYPVSIAAIRVRDGTLDFADRTLTPAFAVKIRRLRGAMRDYSSAPGNVSRLDLRGQVDGYAPARVSGTLGSTAAGPNVNLKLGFQDIELRTFSPYAGKFAGYRIERGTLDLDLEYQLAGQVLAGENHIVLDQLTLGEKVDSPSAMDLPLRLAIALMKDGNGVIDLNLPVRGDLSNPTFDYRSLIGRALRQIIVKAVTAPFKALGGLFPKGKAPTTVPFAPGLEEITDTATQQLQALTQALAQRPVLVLEVQGTAVTDTDGEALASQALDAALEKTSGRDYRRRVSKLYETLFKADMDDLPVPDPEADEDDQRLQAARARLMEHFQPTPALLEALAQRRAQAVAGALRQAGLDAQRIRIGQAEVLPPGKRVRTRLKLTTP